MNQVNANRHNWIARMTGLPLRVGGVERGRGYLLNLPPGLQALLSFKESSLPYDVIQSSRTMKVWLAKQSVPRGNIHLAFDKAKP